ncbi:MAG: ABC transporter permease [Chloroflexi bacterium]|jgi:peptide/nickel transport system permease protein|nr:MAG: ABC transporter permease [Chloroflexota bacterium]
MSTYIFRRVLLSVPTLLAISIVIFAILALAPGDPLSQLALNPGIPESTRQLIRTQFGLDDPWPLRYWKWLTSLLRGDWGFSFSSRSPVIDIVKQRLPQTLQVVGFAYLLAVVLAIPIGILAAVRQYSWFDQLATVFSFVGFSVPSFFTGLLLMLVFAVRLKWFPIVYDSLLGFGSLAEVLAQLRQMAMPVTVLVVQQTAALTRFTRSAMLDNLSQNYVRTARAKGVPYRRVVLRHVLSNSLIPIVTLVALSIPSIFGGAIITENLFRVNGLGALLITSINNSDTPVVMALSFVFAVLMVFSNLVADVMYGVLDPRVRYN